jgi:hypothetical protein
MLQKFLVYSRDYLNKTLYTATVKILAINSNYSFESFLLQLNAATLLPPDLEEVGGDGELPRFRV